MDDDEPSRRESHFNEQRASLRSDTSQSSSARPRSHSRRQSLRQSLPRTREDFDLERPDSDTLPSPPGSPSPAPRVPRDRADVLAGREREKEEEREREREREREKAMRKRDDFHFDFLSAPPPDVGPRPPTRDDSAIQTPRTSRRPSLFARASNSPQSQSNITALPTMADADADASSPAAAAAAASSSSPADRFHSRQPAPRAARLLTHLYTLAFLVFFAIWGALARVGLQTLTFYPGAPVVFSELWANVAGTFIMGFLAEDMQLFRDEWGADTAQPVDRPAEGHQQLEKQRVRDRANHGKTKKTIPLYVGLTTGFCGSFTSFSSFVRDVFLGLSNDLSAPVYHPTAAPSAHVARHAGYSVMAVLAVVFTTVALCFCALKAGAHLAAALDRVTPTLPFRFTRRVVDPLFVLLGLGSWVGAVALACAPPHSAWRGQALFACVFAPLGCLARYYASLALNAINPAFPLGTFACNVFGTAVLGMAFDLQRVSIAGVAGGSVVGCQVLQGIQDGFCGALTTVSTWMLELDTLRRGHAYVYGASSVVVGLSVMTVIMGSVRWSVGWEAVACAA